MPAIIDTSSKTFRAGNSIIEVVTRTTVRHRVVEFEDILLACEVVPDDDHPGAPWKDCDGYDHEVVPLSRMDNLTDADEQAIRGRVYRRSERAVVQVPRDNPALFAYHHDNGCSRQVAAELVAQDRRRTIDQLAAWYRDGWDYWGVTCEFNGEEASCRGFDDLEYADTEGRREIAREVAAALETKGYMVIGQPDYAAEYRRGRVETMRSRLAACSWGGGLTGGPAGALTLAHGPAHPA